MSALDPANTRRLKSSLALLGSPHDGEVVAAARGVGRILAKAGLGFADLCPLTPAQPKPIRPDTSDWQPFRPKPAPLLREHQRKAKLLSVCRFEWNDWERKFLASIAAWDSPLSAKQAQQLRELEMVAAAWRATRKNAA
jgi:hypothetical protein